MSFENDKLERQIFADKLISLSTSISNVAVLPAGRVIAVDAPWGSGKSWIAQKLPAHFENSSKIGATIYIDAFEFDYHHDPFAVVTSAIIDKCNTQTIAIKSLKKAAADVIKVALPAIAKGLVKAGAKTAGLDSDEISEAFSGVADASEKGIQKMLDTFSETKATTIKFKEKLTALSKTYGENKPLVIIIDELDRCRPSFALEMLERIKHLFDVENVIFIFFMHTPAVHSAISKTYGNSINAAEYLSKFISITIGLPNARKVKPKREDQSNFIRHFLDTQYPIPQNGITDYEFQFRDAILELAPYFNASFRDLERVMLFWLIVKPRMRANATDIAYGLLLKVLDKTQFKDLQNRSKRAYEIEVNRLMATDNNEGFNITTYRESFNFGTKSITTPKSTEERQMNQDYINSLDSFTNAISGLELENIQIS